MVGIITFLMSLVGLLSICVYNLYKQQKQTALKLKNLEAVVLAFMGMQLADSKSKADIYEKVSKIVITDCNNQEFKLTPEL